MTATTTPAAPAAVSVYQAIAATSPTGVHATHCGTVGDALIAALAAVLGDKFDAATREAWVLTYNIVAETMLEGAAAARPVGS